MTRFRLRAIFVAATAVVALAWTAGVTADVPTPVPPEQRGTSDAERLGTHDASNIRTRFW